MLFLEVKIIIKKAWNYFSAGEKILWGVSVFIILVSFFAFDGKGYLTLSASVIGVTSLIFNAKGNPAGQALMIVFSIIYGIISFGFAYYGEMITYVGMTMPMAIVSLITWLSNPYEKNKTEVKVNSLCKKEVVFMMFLTLIVTGVFYFILDFFILPILYLAQYQFLRVLLRYILHSEEAHILRSHMPQTTLC